MSGELWVALASVIVSGITSGLALWLTFRERRAAYRQTLYSKQLDGFIDFVTAVRNVRKVVAEYVWRRQALTNHNADELIRAVESADDAYWRWAGIVPKELGPLATKMVAAYWSFNVSEPDMEKTLNNIHAALDQLSVQARLTFRVTKLTDETSSLIGQISQKEHLPRQHQEQKNL